jgi:hypothetical protein
MVLFDNDNDVQEVACHNPSLGVTTLALGSRPRQGVARLQAKRETQESHHMFLRVQRV